MALPLDQLIQPLTKEQVRASILSLLGMLGLNTTAWQPGSPTLAIITVIAQLIATFSEGIAFFVRMGFLDHATGAYLTLLAYYLFGVLRIEATQASGNCTVTNASGALYSFEIGEFIAKNSTTKATFTNSAPFTLQPTGDPDGEDVATVPMEAQVAGSGGTSSPGDIDALVSSIIGVSITNPTSLIGADEELDSALRTRCRDKLGSLSPNGPKGAYAYVAKSALDADGNPIGINRVQVVPADGTGVLTIYLATPSGSITNPNRVIVRDLFEDQCVPDGVEINVHSATNVTVPVVADIWIYTASGLSSVETETLVTSALNAYFPILPIGGLVLSSPPGAVLFRALEAVIAGVSEHTIEARVTPETDVYLSEGEVAVPGAYTITVHQVEGP